MPNLRSSDPAVIITREVPAPSVVVESSQIRGANIKIPLFGEVPTIKCIIGGKMVEEAIFDTGSSFTSVSEAWLKKNGVVYKLKKISDTESFIGANGLPITVSGKAKFSFEFNGNVFNVPFVITNGESEFEPIIGINTIQAVHLATLK